MHITHPLKRNIFTGLWHRTLPTLHSMSQTKSPPSSSQTHPRQLALLYSLSVLVGTKDEPQCWRDTHLKSAPAVERHPIHKDAK